MISAAKETGQRLKWTQPLPLTLGAITAYALAFVPIHRSVGAMASSLAVFPVAVAAWQVGPLAGVLGGLGGALLNVALFRLVGLNGWAAALDRGWLTIPLLMTCGLVTGRLGQLHRRARNQANLLSQERENLRREVEARRQATDALRQSEEHFRSAFHSAPIGMALVGRDGRWLRVNRAFCDMLGYTERELMPLTFRDITYEGDREPNQHDFQEMMSGGVALREVEKRYIHKQGHLVWTQVSASIVHGPSGRPDHIILQVQDVTQRKNFESQLVELANYDPLTGLINRRRLNEEFELQLARSRRLRGPGALLFLDLDQFKDVNDSLGHRAGDELLAHVAEIMKEGLRDTDILGRLGGDEFAVLMPDADRVEAEREAGRILQAVERDAVPARGQPIHITASIGITLYPEHSESAEELLTFADVAMYHAKQNGGNRFTLYRPEEDWQAGAVSRRSWEHRIREALEKDLFVLHYQPILDLQRNEVSQYELLLRMMAPNGRPVQPALFLDVAERFGLIRQIDRWVVRQAIRTMAELRRNGEDLCLEVNLSGRSFGDPELLGLIQQEIQDTGVDPGRLILEITETAAVADVKQARQFIDTLKKMGCRFALDDFGVGFSSLFNLKHLPVDYLKIDGSFIRTLAKDPVDRHLVRAMVELAAGLHMRTVAEFVADAETLRLLRELGVDYAQGYHIGRPRNVAEILPQNAGGNRLRA